MDSHKIEGAKRQSWKYCNTKKAFQSSGGSGGASGDKRPGAQALRTHQHTFYSHLKTVLSWNLDQSMLKNAYFWKKTEKPPQRREHTLHPFFTSNFAVFVDEGRKNISWLKAQGTLATPTVSKTDGGTNIRENRIHS